MREENSQLPNLVGHSATVHYVCMCATAKGSLHNILSLSK